jgi:hypothetical protein
MRRMLQNHAIYLIGIDLFSDRDIHDLHGARPARNAAEESPGMP